MTIDALKIGAQEFAELCRAVSSKSGSFRFRASGHSMRPFLFDGDLVTVTVVPPKELRVGDIVLYQTVSELPLVHRILKKRLLAGQIILSIRGDATRGPCDLVEAFRVIARVEEVQRGSRRFAPRAWRHRFPALVWAATPRGVRRMIARTARFLGQ